MSEVRWATAFLVYRPDAAEAGSRFWEQATGWTLSTEQPRQWDLAQFVPPDGDPLLRVHVLPDREGIHLDLSVTDLGSGVGHALDLGAVQVSAEATSCVLRSPGGFSFCLVQDEGYDRRPAPSVWPGGASLVDQVCLDLPAHAAQSEVAFWSALTGWRFRGSDSPEFCRLNPPPQIPLQLLLQTLGEDDSRRDVQAHLDLSCQDKDAEAERHVGLGAELLHRNDWHWTVLRDPGGVVYCVTGRKPGDRPS